jgi:hypothetical protein
MMPDMMPNAARGRATRRAIMNRMATAVALLIALTEFSRPSAALAHCDRLDGPVVTAARQALQSGDLAPVLIWVRAEDAAGVKEAFEKTVAVRTTGDRARDLADMYFFETVVRIHRAGEGAAYTGLKPAGGELDPAVAAADQALQDGSVESLVALLTGAVRHGVLEQFEAVHAKKRFAPNDVEAGRKYIDAYVSFIHYVVRVREAATSAAHGHFPEGAGPAAYVD